METGVSMLSLSLRPIAVEDESFLCEVYASTRADELALTGWGDEQRDQFVRMQFAAQSQHYAEHYKEAAFDVILVDGERAGRLIVDRRASALHIVDIALLPAYRGRGIGTELIGSLQNEATSRGVPVSIHVERFNPAVKLYHRLGFTIVEDKGVYLLMQWTPA